MNNLRVTIILTLVSLLFIPTFLHADDEVNGCGSPICGLCPKFMHDVVPFSQTFEKACNQHDRNYSKSGMSKREADKAFYRDMKKIADKESDILKPFARASAWAYYTAVKLGGDCSYDEAQKKARKKAAKKK